ncbi:hypothetical protein A9X06_15800 [Mycobacterium sp. 852002-51759_SCH5129042]|nr:hypothetical protein A9X06_15800 [Mycobacterium sp. 852002-51759_SCH5129042]
MLRIQDANEQRAKDVLTEQLGVALVKIDPGKSNIPTPDFRSADASVAVEVKTLTSGEHLGVLAAARTTEFRVRPKLSWLWTYLLNTPNALESFVAKDDSTIPLPVGRKLEAQLEPLLMVLEKHGIEDWRRQPADPTSEAYKACWQVGRLVRFSECSRMEPIPDGWGPGILNLGVGFGHRGKRDPNEIIETIEAFLTTKDGINLRRSLEAERGQRHGVLVADWTVSEWHTVEELGEAYLPNAPFALPEEIDYLWVIIVGRWVRYGRQAGTWIGGVMPANSRVRAGDAAASRSPCATDENPPRA